MALFGTSGIRRIADRDLLEIALKTGLAVGKLHKRVIVGCDTRTSGEAVKFAFISGLLASGGESFDAGVLPTPTLALAARKFDAGAMITASHNPPEYNGIKLVNPDGSAFDSIQREQFEGLINDISIAAAPWREMKGNHSYEGAIREHQDSIKRDFPLPIKLKVVLDCGCGAASVITPDLLRQMGCEVITLNCSPSGIFPHDVEPIAANLSQLIQASKEFGADLGIAHDGDADRMMAVDDKGRFIPGDKLLMLLAEQMGANKVVTTLDASMVIDEMGIDVTRTKIGDIYVSEELKKGGEFGGEPSGAWVFPKHSFCPDGIYAAAMISEIASRHKLSDIVDRIPQYSILRGSIPKDKIDLSFELEKKLMALKPLSVSNIDGIRLTFEDGWVLIRASGTEPKIRLTAEAKSEMRVRELYRVCLHTLEGHQGAGKEK
jgi:phosphoglucosamine mutase